MTEAAMSEQEYHDGVLYGIRHPGASQLACPYCAATLAQRDMIARWLTPPDSAVDSVGGPA